MKNEKLLRAIGDIDDALVSGAASDAKKRRMPRWARWTSAAAACLALVIAGGAFFLIRLGASSGGGGDSDLVYMNYVGPVMPLTVRGDSSGITAERDIDFDFSPYISTTESYETEDGEIRYYEASRTEVMVTDAYTLTNESAEDRTVTLLYPVIANVSAREYFPEITVDGQPASLTLHPGPYTGGFSGAWGSGREGSINIAQLSSFEGYQTLLADDSYLRSAFDEFPAMDAPVTVYRLHDFVYSAAESANPTLSMEFYIDFEKTYVFTYGMNGASFDYDTGFCSRIKGGIEYRPNARENRRYPDDGYVIILGDDLKEYTVQGYMDGGCDAGEELDDLSCTVTRYECTLGEIVSELLGGYLGETYPAEENPASANAAPAPEYMREIYLGLTAELLYSYGQLGQFPVERYDTGMLEEIFSDVNSGERIIYFAFDAVIPAGGSVSVKAAMLRDESCDFIGKDRGRDGYDMASRLGSNIGFTRAGASISGYDEIEIVQQNFGFDIKNGVTQVSLDLNEPHYYLEVRKIVR